mmetsp:Transcript_27816/g.75057  ORF Transcript_27816/g.75057 Transcript_27816/m.75057 type:complete len:85 (+) Transcript_27816:2173-2427(+)
MQCAAHLQHAKYAKYASRLQLTLRTACRQCGEVECSVIPCSHGWAPVVLDLDSRPLKKELRSPGNPVIALHRRGACLPTYRSFQ